eukprot:scaffold68746_cov72-Phaeocystis_antarctica.AAC.2
MSSSGLSNLFALSGTESRSISSSACDFTPPFFRSLMIMSCSLSRPAASSPSSSRGVPSSPEPRSTGRSSTSETVWLAPSSRWLAMASLTSSKVAPSVRKKRRLSCILPCGVYEMTCCHMGAPVMIVRYAVTPRTKSPASTLPFAE